MRITADSRKCLGTGYCVLTEPDVFDQDEDGTVLLLQPRPPDLLRQAVRRAVGRCPTGAIQLVGDDD